MQDRNQQVSINIFDQINQICQEFRRGWKDGRRPRIEDVLPRVSVDARNNLFSNLIQLEILIRESQNERPCSAEYLKRFPNFANLVRQAFDESTNMSVDLKEESPAFDSADFKYPEGGSDSFDSLASRNPRYASLELPAARRIGDYELIRELGRGGMGVVYEARHLKQGNLVALKTLPTGVDGQQVNAERLHRFRKEFRSLSEINHPNLVGMQTLEVDGGQWFFTMDLIDGVDFLSYVQPHGQFDERRLRDTLQQLVLGISELHNLRIVHRDLKPSNVLVDSSGRVSILDFGLVAEMQQVTDLSQTRSGMFAGTPRYAAPEQMFGQRSEASDWYALGVMLYEALTGQLPYVAKDQMELMRQKHQEDPPLLSDHDDVPSDLAILVDGLIRREPKERLASGEIIEVLGINLETVAHGSTAASEGSTGSVDEPELDAKPEYEDEILIGREEQLAQLEAARQELIDKKEPVVVWITGKSGEGKSSLAEKFLRPLREGTEMLVLSGRCYDRESVPFKAIDSIIDPLTSFLRSKQAEWLLDRLPQDFHLLARLFPILSRVKTIDEIAKSDQGPIDERQVRFRAFYALGELFKTFSSTTPLVVFLDDLQWGDSDSADVIFELLAQLASSPILFVGGYRSDESESSPFIQQWNRLNSFRQTDFATRNVEVRPLTQAQVVQLVTDRVGSGGQRLREQTAEIFADTRGNPYFIEQLIDGFDPRVERFEHVPLDQVIERKLARLPRESTDLLQAIAIAGQAVSLDEAARVTDLETTSYSLVTRMRSERLVRLVGTADQYLVDTYHDKIRETVIGRLEKQFSIQWHSRYADLLESQLSISIDEVYKFLESADPYDRFPFGIERAFDLAYHFERSGNTYKAFGYYFLAAEQAAHSYANDESAAAFARAETMIPAELAKKIHYRLYLGIGQTHRRSKQTDEAIVKLQQAVELAESSYDKAVAYTELGIVYDQAGRPRSSIPVFYSALEFLRDQLPTTTFGKLLSIGINAFRTVVIPAEWQTYRGEDKRRLATLREIIWSHVWVNQLEVAGVLDSLDSCLRFSIAAFQSGNPGYVAISHANAALALSANGIRWPGSSLLSRSKRINAQVQDPLVAAQIHFSQGFCSYFLGDLRDARTGLHQAVEELERCGNYKDSLMGKHILRHTETYLGTTSVEQRAAEKVKQLAYEVNHSQRICWGEYDMAAALSRRGELAPALKSMSQSYAALDKDRYIHTESIRDATHAYVMLQCSDYESSRQSSMAAWELNFKSFAFIETSMFCVPLIIESHCGPNWMASLLKNDMQPLKRALRLADIFYFNLPNHQPHLLRVCGRAAMALGKQRKAIRKLEKAVKLSARKGMDYQRARSLLDLAAVKEQGRDENRAEAIELLKQMESVIPRAESWLLGDQYDEAVVAPEFDLAAWERENGPIRPQTEDAV